MHKLIAILMVFCLILSLSSCRRSGKNESMINESTSSDAIATDNTNPSSTSDSNNDSEDGKTSNSNSDSTANPDTSTNTNSNSNGTSTSPSKNSSSDQSKGEVVTRVINYVISSDEVYATTFNTSYWKMPYAKEDDGTFTREGYVLLGYSFDANGNGQLIRPGHKYTLPTNDSEQNLYCVWAKETNQANFKTTSKSTSTVYITGYTGNDNIVYIPRKIGGKTVTGIASNAFANNKSITEVHITSSIDTVEKDSFASCSNLRTVTLYDNLKSISDSSFSGAPVKTVRMCAGKTPRYITSDETYGMKYERLTKTYGQKRIIVLAGSSVLYGIDSDFMENQFQNDYAVINFGTNASMNVLFYLDAIKPMLTTNDIVIFAPEQYGPYAYHTNGNPEFTAVTLQGLSSCYNFIENVDISLYTDFFNSVGQYCTESYRMKSLSWESHSNNIDKYGDLASLTSKMNSPNFIFGANGDFRFDSSVIPSDFISNLNRAINNISQSSARIYFSYPPHNKNNIVKSSLNENAYDTYNAWIAQTVQCPLISDIRNYIYEAKYFANTDYHLNAVGRNLHSKQLAQDIINAGIGVK